METFRDRIRMLAPCDLSVYRAIVRALPRPSEEQVADFVAYVSGAHSWYKHLPLMPPGVSFVFFLDPSAGCDWVPAPDGGLVPRERVDPNERFHYTWMLTAEYRRRFGHLAYDSGRAPAFVVGSRAAPRVHAEYPVFVAKGLTARIPDEVVRASTAEVTGIVHKGAAAVLVHRGARLLGSERSWPEQTGGEVTKRAILALAERHAGTWERYREATAPVYERERARLGAATAKGAMRARLEREARERAADLTSAEFAAYYAAWEQDLAEMQEVLRPERQRLEKTLAMAIDRMLRLVHEVADP